MRLQNWPSLISAEIKKLQKTPFVWGEKDCCLAVGDIMQTYTGTDYAAEFRGKYKTALGSARALKRYGKGSIRDTMDAKLPSIPVEEACRGDVGLVKTDAGESLAIIFSQQAWAMAEHGMEALPMTDLVCAWRVE